MTVFYLLRHGQSEANVKRIFTGQLDRYGLSPLGRRQAERAADYLADRGIDRIYSSDLLRARQTAEYVGRRLGQACGKFSPAHGRDRPTKRWRSGIRSSMPRGVPERIAIRMAASARRRSARGCSKR